jgi:polar amino acid transport system substrate-binding protein
MRFFSIICVISLLPLAASAADVKVAFGLSVPPYIIPESTSGIETDIIREALAYKGHTITPIYIPFSTINAAFIDTQANAIATVEEKIGIDGYFSDVVVTYQNYAVALSNNHISIKTIDDLKNYSVMAFQLATRYLGTDFAQMVKNNPRYREKQDQKKIVQLFFDGKTEIIITEANIFNYYSNQLFTVSDVSQKVDRFDLFPPNHYKVVFRDKQIRDDFNEGLAHLRTTGEYQKIFDRYLTPTHG